MLQNELSKIQIGSFLEANIFPTKNWYPTWKHSLMTSHIRVGRGVQDSPKKGRYKVGQGRYIGQNGQKTWDVINERSLILLCMVIRVVEF